MLFILFEYLLGLAIRKSFIQAKPEIAFNQDEWAHDYAKRNKES